jgi:hypothetical protein
MSKIEQLLALSESDSKAFDNFIYSIADTIPGHNHLLKNEPFIKDNGLVAGYQVYFGYRLINEKLLDGGMATHVEIAIFNIFNFLGDVVINNSTVLEEVKSSIMGKLKKENS